MNKEEVKAIEHFAYPVPFGYELKQSFLQPYRTNKKLEAKIHYLFSHPTFIHRETFVEVSESGSKGLVKDMSVRAVAIMRYFLKHPQQFAHKVDNIHMQILIRMWKQVHRHKKYQHKEIGKYQYTKMSLLMIENGFIEELIRTCDEQDYIQDGEDMMKQPKKKVMPKKVKGLKDGSKYFEYLCSLE
jgi:hypothetical protein